MATLMEKDSLLNLVAYHFGNVIRYKIKNQIGENEKSESYNALDKLGDIRNYLYSTDEEELDFYKLVAEINKVGKNYE